MLGEMTMDASQPEHVQLSLFKEIPSPSPGRQSPKITMNDVLCGSLRLVGATSKESGNGNPFPETQMKRGK